MPEIQKVTDILSDIVWNKRQVTKKPDIKPNGKNWLMDTMPFHAVLKEKLTDDRPLQYRAEGKYVSFKPVGGLSAKGLLSKDKRAVAYKNGLGNGISLEVEISQAHWRKLIKIDSLEALGNIEGKEFVEFIFEVKTNFGIPERENKEPRIQLGRNSFIEVSKLWDSSSEFFDEKWNRLSRTDITIKSFFTKKGGKLYFIKQIPTEWLRAATFPVWTDVDIAWGTMSPYGVDSWRSRCCEIDTNKFVVVYESEYILGYYGRARVATVSGTTITWGDENQFCECDCYEEIRADVCKLDTDKFVVVYTDHEADDDGFAVVGTVATRTISWGTPVEFETGDTRFSSCCQIGTNKFAIAYNDVTAGPLGTVCICTVADSVITAGTPVAFEGDIAYCRCCALDADKFVAFYTDVTDWEKGKACVFTVSNTTPTAGAIKEIDSNTSWYMDCRQLDTDKFVISWLDASNFKGKVEICTVSGTTITEGAEVEFNDATTSGIGLAKVDGSHFILTYKDHGNSDKGTSRFCSFSGTTITLGDEEIFHDAGTRDTAVCLISTKKVAVVYRDAGGAGAGEAIIGFVPEPVVVTPATLALILTTFAPEIIMIPQGPSVRIAFDSDPFDETPIWTDVSGDLVSFASKRGRQHQLDRIEAGTASILLKNLHGNYWPNNTEGDYYPEVKLGKRINIRVGYSAIRYDEYTGFVRKWVPFWFSQAGNLYPGMKLECTDLQRNLARAKLNHAGYGVQKSGVRIGSVLTTVGWPAAARDIDTGKENMIATGALVNVASMDHLFKVQESELGILFVRGDGYVVFHERGALEALESQATFGTGNLPIFDPEFPLDDELLYNEVRLTREGGAEQVESNAASILAHSLRTLSRSGLLLTSDVIVKLYCLYLIARYHAAKMRIKSFTVKPQTPGYEAQLWPLVLGLDIGQKITLVWTEADISGDYFIEGIEQSFDYREGVWVTKFQCSDAGQFYFEPGAVEDLLRPNAEGDETNIDGVVGKPTHWEAVEDSSTGTYVINDTTSWQRDLYNVGSLVGSGGTISKITAYILCMQEDYSGGVTGRVKVAIKSGDTVAEGDLEMPAVGSWSTFSKEWAKNPDTDEDWTWEEIEDLQIGVNMKGGSLGPSPPYWMKCMRSWVVVEYTPTW